MSKTTNPPEVGSASDAKCNFSCSISPHKDFTSMSEGNVDVSVVSVSFLLPPHIYTQTSGLRVDVS